jgi:hypothetical protein
MKGYTSFIHPLLIVPLFVGLSARAQEKISTDDVLIEKLSGIQLHLSAKDPSKVPVSLRLADLYAERARQKSLKELADGCTVCEAGRSDREQALKFYLEVLDQVPASQQGRVMLQVGHLYEMNGQEAKAIDFYQGLLKKQTSQEAVLESHFSLAEVFFKKRQYSEAFEHYLKVSESASGSRARAAYRAAWCLFNLGKIDQSSQDFEKILSTPDLLGKTVGTQKQIDTQFQEEVMRDWITVLTQQKWDGHAPEKLYKLAPEKSRISMLTTFALELERIGKKTEAVNTWEYAFENISEPRVKLQAYSHRAFLYQDSDIKKASENFEAALTLWGSVPECQNAKSCDEEYKLLKNFVIGWNKKEKLNPSSELVLAYQKYLGVFKNEADMHLWLAELSEQMKNWNLSIAEYQKASSLLEGDEKENALLKQIEIAEKSQAPEQIVSAQDFYLQNSIKKSKEFEVRYQRLHQTYDKAQYAEAFTGLKELALNQNGNRVLRKQAADLALDCLVLTKEDAKLQATAQEFAQIFGGAEAVDFNKVYEKTLLSQSAQFAQAGQNSQAYDALMKFDVAHATDGDRIIFLKNKILLSQKLGRFNEARPAVDELLAAKGLTSADQDFAWAQKAYLAELFLDFKSAKIATEKIQVKGSAEEKTKFLKLALFTELLGEKANSEYQNLLKNASTDEERAQIQARIIRNSTKPDKDLVAAKAKFATQPEIYSRLALEVYSSTASPVVMKSVLADKKLEATNSGVTLRTYAWTQDYDVLKKKLSNHTLDTKKQTALARTLKERVKLLEQAESLANLAIERKDWTAELLGLNLVALESQRFYQDLLSAPVPQGLSAEEEQNYLNLLSAQAAPYQAKSQDAGLKVQEFWGNADWKKSFQTAWSDDEMKFYVRNEVSHLNDIASEGNKKTLADTMTVDNQKPTMAELEMARNKVRENPLSLESLKALQNLEMKSHNTAMVQYLEIRVKDKQ